MSWMMVGVIASVCLVVSSLIKYVFMYLTNRLFSKAIQEAAEELLSNPEYREELKEDFINAILDIIIENPHLFPLSGAVIREAEVKTDG